jgi:hypothetical protein
MRQLLPAPPTDRGVRRPQLQTGVDEEVEPPPFGPDVDDQQADGLVARLGAAEAGSVSAGLAPNLGGGQALPGELRHRP